MNRLKKFISTSLIVTLIFLRVLSVVPVLAQEVPTVPPPPPMPDTLSSVPTVPPPPDTSYTLPTAAPPPTNPPPPADVPTVPPLPTSSGGDPLPTSDQIDSLSGITPTGGSLEDPTNQSNPNGYSSEGNASGTSTNSSGEINDPANIATGALSTNYAEEIVNQKLEVMNQNLAQMQNKIDQISSTGFNYANLNTLDGQVFTGDTQAKLNLLNKLNSTMTGVGAFSVFNIYDNYLGDIVFNLPGNSINQGFSQASGTVSKNAVTGYGSDNTAIADSQFTVKEANGNDAEIVNDINLAAITGSNSASFNTGNGVVSTGDASAIGNVINLANTNLNVSNWLFGVVNIFGEYVGNIILPQGDSSGSGGSTLLSGNSNTGAMSNNTANYTSNTTASFENTNNADIVSAVNTSANSGNNTASVNTGGGYVATGNTDVAVSNSTIANINTVQEEETVWMVIVNEAGKWVGHILGSPWGATSASNALPIAQTTTGAGFQTFTTTNAGTGAFSDNVASQNTTTNTQLSNENTAKITNNVTATADTGNNQAAYNTGAGVIETGDANVGLNLVNMANTNVVAKKFVAILVNILGSWAGDVVTPGQNASGNTTSATGGVAELPTIAPLPTIPPLGSADNFDSYNGESNEYADSYYQDQTSQTNEIYYYYYPETYTQAVNTVNTARQKTYTTRQYYSQGVPEQQQVENQINQIKEVKRGIFLSPAFAKATQSSIAAMLLGGASIRVTNSWLWIVPVALFLFIIRRRKKYDISKYVHALLEVIL
ncbi:hypothetical protein HYW55_03615 [Candidatus Gottesmanbacteria bacterium]|nr:hypothetical protein [Candidatus Gottesmanbacteria bacterium]